MKNSNGKNKISVQSILVFILKNFATPIVFYIVFREAGTKPAIAFAIGATGVQVLAHRVFRWRISPFFVLASVFTVCFGGIDLLVENPRFFRLEAFAQNFTLGTLFLLTLYTRESLAWRFAKALPEGVAAGFADLDAVYMRRLTQIWAAYFYFKAFAFLYLALRVDLGTLYIYRVILGNISAFLLFFGEIGYRKYFRGRRGRP